MPLPSEMPPSTNALSIGTTSAPCRAAIAPSARGRVRPVLRGAHERPCRPGTSRPFSVNGRSAERIAHAGAQRLDDRAGARPSPRATGTRRARRAAPRRRPRRRRRRASTADRPPGTGVLFTVDDAVRRHDLDVEGERQAPRGDVVNLLAQPLLAAALLLLHERFGLRHVCVEQVAQQPSRPAAPPTRGTCPPETAACRP